MMQKSLLINLLFVFCIFGSEPQILNSNTLRYTISDSSIRPLSFFSEITNNHQSFLLMGKGSTYYNGPNNELLLTKNFGNNRRTKKPSHYKRIYRYRQHFIFTGIGLATAITSAILNSAARSQYKKEKDCYETYITAEENSDFDKLWNKYEDAKDKTDSYLKLRGIFAITSGAIGISLIFAFMGE